MELKCSKTILQNAESSGGSSLIRAPNLFFDAMHSSFLVDLRPSFLSSQNVLLKRPQKRNHRPIGSLGSASFGLFASCNIAFAFFVGYQKSSHKHHRTLRCSKHQLHQSEAGGTSDEFQQLCKAVTVENLATVLLPAVDSQEKLQQALKIFGRKKEGKLAFATLETVRLSSKTVTMNLGAPTYNLVISSCGKSNLWIHALTLLEAMPKAKVQPDVISFSAAISACEKGGQWQGALSLLDTMPKAKIRPNVFSYSAAISACEKGGKWQEALFLFQAMPTAKVQPDIFSYSAAISACEKGRQWQQALFLFQAMPTAKVHPNDYSYNAAISACEKGGQWQQALLLFQAMPTAKVHPNDYSYNAAISACEKGGQWQQALLLFQAMPTAKVQPNVISFSAAISACEKGGQWQEPLVLFQAMSTAKVQPDVISYNAAISACEKGGQWQQALFLFQAMSTAKVHPNDYSYNAAISACEKGGQWKEALSLFQAMFEAKVVPEVISFSAAISACEKGGQWQEALTLFKNMLDVHVEPNLVSYNALFDIPAICGSDIGSYMFKLCKLRSISALRECEASKIDLHNLSEGTAQLVLCHWLETAVAQELEGNSSLTCTIITGYGKSRKLWDCTDVRQAALDLLIRLKLKASPSSSNRGIIKLVLKKKDLPKLQTIKSSLRERRSNAQSS